jgi:hypothetical protein
MRSSVRDGNRRLTERAAMPGEVRDVFSGEKHDASLIRQRLR